MIISWEKKGFFAYISIVTTRNLKKFHLS